MEAGRMVRRTTGPLLARTMHLMHDPRFYTPNRCCAVIPALSPRVATLNSNRNYPSPACTTPHYTLHLQTGEGS